MHPHPLIECAHLGAAHAGSCRESSGAALPPPSVGRARECQMHREPLRVNPAWRVAAVEISNEPAVSALGVAAERDGWSKLIVAVGDIHTAAAWEVLEEIAVRNPKGEKRMNLRAPESRCFTGDPVAANLAQALGQRRIGFRADALRRPICHREAHSSRLGASLCSPAYPSLGARS
jgi:hypothetical protein